MECIPERTLTPRPENRSDAVIIGASAAGLFAAYLLARGGLHVRLFDAGGATPRTSRTLIVTRGLDDALGFSAASAIVNRINRFDLFSQGRSASVELAAPDLVVERRKILEMLADMALDAGADVRFGYQFVNIEAAAAVGSVTIRDVKRDRLERVITPRLVGADGAASRVGRLFDTGSPSTAPLLQAVVVAPPDLAPNVTQVWFEPADTPFFYWVIPDGPGRASVGLIGTDGREAVQSLRRFLVARGMAVHELQAGRIPVARHPRPWQRVSGCDVFLVGDAAGQVKVTTVGGLVTGLRGGRAVAESILTGAPYRKRLRGLDRELMVHRWVRLILNRFRPADYDELLDRLDAPTARLLGAYTRDELAQTFLRLLMTQPRLLTFGRRLLLR